MIDARRRTLLRGTLAGAVGAAGLLGPCLTLADWNSAAFTAKDQADALKSLLGSDAIETSEAILIKVPDIADNGASVLVTVETSLPNIRSIAIIALGHANPLVATFDLGAATLPYVSTRIRLSKTSDLVAVVKQGDKLFSNTKTVKVASGGCEG